MYLDVQRKGGKVFTFYASVDAHWSRTQYLKAYRCNATRFEGLILAALRDFLNDRIRLRSALKKMGMRGDEVEMLAAIACSALHAP
jgi:hypothetical protein